MSSRKRTNKKLRKLYEDVYKKGKERFFTFSTDYVTREVMSNVNFKGKKVLEVGCGTGETAFCIARAGGKIIAADYAPEAIKIAQERYHHENLEYHAARYQDIKGIFDIIVLQETIEHMDNPLRDLRNLKKKLKPKGKIVITCPSFMNVRGYVWMTLQLLFNVPMSLSDVQFLSPFDFEEWAKKLDMKLAWHTFNFDLGNNEKMMYDLGERRRLKNALRDANMKGDTKKLLSWLERVSRYDHTLPHSGAKGFYILQKK
jgi:2-polyprenyl-3-methyl-5-hydroxy-6-metoxy-1,4-benzoquinol methylase